MGLLDWFKNEDEQVIKIGKEDLREKLSTHIDRRLVDEVMDGFETDINNIVKEKRNVSYEDIADSFSEQIQNIWKVPEVRIRQLKLIDDFVKENAEVFNIIKLYASEICFGSVELKVDEYKTVIMTDNEARRKKAQALIKKFERESKIKRKLYNVTKDLIKYGDSFFEKKLNGELFDVLYIPANFTIIRNNENAELEKLYQIKSKSFFNDLLSEIDISHLITGGQFNNLENDDKAKFIEFNPDELIHFSDGTIPGHTDSPLINLAIIWRSLKYLEESLVIHRLTRARRLLVFFLDVTNKTGEEVKNSVRYFTQKLKGIFSISQEEGLIYNNKSTIKADSDIVIPVSRNTATDVKHIPADQLANNIDDLKFYHKRILSNFLVTHIFSTDKVQNSEHMERALLRIIRTYQKQMTYTLEDLYNELMKMNDFDDVEISVVFPSPDIEEEMKLVDSILRRMMVVNQLIATTSTIPPEDWIVKYVFKDLSQNELEELISMLHAEKEKDESKSIGNEISRIFDEVPNKGDSDDFVKLFEKYENSDTVHEKKVNLINESIKMATNLTKSRNNINKKYDNFDE